MSNIPAAVLAEAHEAFNATFINGKSDIGSLAAFTAVLARHWPAPETRTIFQYPPGTERAGFSCNGVNLEGRKIDVEQLERWHHDATVRLPHFEKDYSELTVFRAELERLRAARRDRYAAGFAAGVEKAAAAFHSTTALLSRGEIITAIRALAPPDDDLLVGRLRWEKWPGGEAAYLGKIPVGWVLAASEGRWVHRTRLRTGSHYADTLEAARAALVEAVRREVEGGGDE